MRRSLFTTALFLLLIPATLHAGPTVANFKLNTIDGKPWSLDTDAKDKKAVVVVFIGTQCPINNAYMPKLVELEKAYRDKGVVFVAINANHHDAIEAIQKHAKKYELTFPVLRDEKNVIADRFGAERHPTAFLLDSSRTVRYQGRIDDQYGIGYNRPAPTRRDLASAIDQVLAGKAVSQEKTAVEGCFITKAPAPKVAKSDVTYAKDVARILQNRCQECHRPGQIGPMPLLTYDDASSWAQMIREVVKEKRMPPWHADPKVGAFANDRRLGADERAKLLAWVDAGCPQGDDKDLPAAKKFAEGWSIGKPDAVFTFKDAVTVPAKNVQGVMKYKWVLIPTDFEEDKWVQAVEAKPGNHSVVHHIIVYIAKGKQKNIDGIGNGLLVAYAGGSGRRLPRRGGQEAAEGGGARVPDALYADGDAAGGSLVDRAGVCEGAARRRGEDACGHAAGVRDPRQRRQSSGDKQDDVRQGDDPLQHVSAHASARQGFQVRGGLSGQKARDALVGAAL